ncbi:hypothetical protein PYR74_10105 [Acinetobacter bereziniae]|nr:hypothetical protein PYR74_10105 [Acinetobacter bereziniae]
MDKLNHRELTLIKCAAEDAIHACNRHYGPFVDVVAHPLNIIALVEMAQSKQAEINQLQSQINEMAEVGLSQESVIKEKDKRIESALSELESLHNKKWAEWKEQADMHSQGEANAYEHAMQILEKTLRGEHANS